MKGWLLVFDPQPSVVLAVQKTQSEASNLEIALHEAEQVTRRTKKKLANRISEYRRPLGLILILDAD